MKNTQQSEKHQEARKPIYYLGAPYTHSDPKIRAFRAKAVTQMAYNLFNEGRLVYSPLTHNIPIDRLGILGDYLSWLDFDHGMLAHLDGLIVLQLPGWETSRGLKAEMDEAKMLGLSIEVITPTEAFLSSICMDDEANSQFTKISNAVNQMVEERDWKQFNSLKNIAMSLHVEAAEVADHFVWLSPEQSDNLSPEVKQKVSAELGDVFINVILLSNQLGIDLFAATEQKLEEIKSRYPIETYKGKQT